MAGGLTNYISSINSKFRIDQATAHNRELRLARIKAGEGVARINAANKPNRTPGPKFLKGRGISAAPDTSSKALKLNVPPSRRRKRLTDDEDG